MGTITVLKCFIFITYDYARKWCFKSYGFIFTMLSYHHVFLDYGLLKNRFIRVETNQQALFRQERVEYNVFLFDEPLKGSKSLKIFKISLTYRFDKLWHLSKSVHTGQNSQILIVLNKKIRLWWFEFWIMNYYLLNPSPPGGTAILPEYIHYYGYYYQVIVQCYST
jgi:hypothetical protein